jgi:adenylate kinase family enzyme
MRVTFLLDEYPRSMASWGYKISRNEKQYYRRNERDDEECRLLLLEEQFGLQDEFAKQKEEQVRQEANVNEAQTAPIKMVGDIDQIVIKFCKSRDKQ